MSSRLSDPFPHAAVVTPSDTVDLPVKAHSLWIGNFGGAATLAVITASGEKLALTLGTPGAAAFFVLPIQVSRVLVAGTANVGTIVALWH